MEELKQCPFCGNTDICGFWNDDNEYEVGCHDCCIRVSGQTIAEAEESWNKRTGG